jgi:hypothetical protein
MILLNKTRLNLRRGLRYGLCGPNGVGLDPHARHCFRSARGLPLSR